MVLIPSIAGFHDKQLHRIIDSLSADYIDIGTLPSISGSTSNWRGGANTMTLTDRLKTTSLITFDKKLDIDLYAKSAQTTNSC